MNRVALLVPVSFFPLLRLDLFKPPCTILTVLEVVVLLLLLLLDVSSR